MGRLGTCLATLTGLLLTAAGDTFSGKRGCACRGLGSAGRRGPGTWAAPCGRAPAANGRAGQGARRAGHRVCPSPARARGRRGGRAPSAPEGRADESRRWPRSLAPVSAPAPPRPGRVSGRTAPLGVPGRFREQQQKTLPEVGSCSRRPPGVGAARSFPWRAAAGPGRRARCARAIARPVSGSGGGGDRRSSPRRPASGGLDPGSSRWLRGCPGEPRRRPRRSRREDRRPGGSGRPADPGPPWLCPPGSPSALSAPRNARPGASVSPPRGPRCPVGRKRSGGEVPAARGRSELGELLAGGRVAGSRGSGGARTPHGVNLEHTRGWTAGACTPAH